MIPYQHVDADFFSSRISPENPQRDAVASYVDRYLSRAKDPAAKSAGMPPMYGEDAMPHIGTFSGMIGTHSRTYLLPEEYADDNGENARLMRKDVGIMECLLARQRLTALLGWSIEPEDDKSPVQKALATELEKIIGRIRRFVEYRRVLLEAIWYGKYGIQHRYGNVLVNGRMVMMPKSPIADHPGWMPIHGDKIVYRYEDVWSYDPDKIPHQMGIRISHAAAAAQNRLRRYRDPEPTADGLAIFLEPYERETICVHKNEIEDADYHDSRRAGVIHGVGVRARIYQEWFLKQESLAFLMEYLERSGGGVEVWYYPSGDPNAKRETMKAAEDRLAHGRNQIFFPRPVGEDSSYYEVQFIEPGFAGVDMMREIVDQYFGHRIKRLILGQTLTTEAAATGLGSGVADAHQDTLYQIVCYDSRNLEDTLTHELVRYLQMRNFPETIGMHMRFAIKTDDDNAAAKMEAFQQAYDMGVRIPERDVINAIGTSMPKDDDRLLERQPPDFGMGGLGGDVGFQSGGQQAKPLPPMGPNGGPQQYKRNGRRALISPKR